MDSAVHSQETTKKCTKYHDPKEAFISDDRRSKRSSGNQGSLSS